MTEPLCPYPYEPADEIPGTCCRVQKRSWWAKVFGCPTGWKPAKYTEDYCVSTFTSDCLVGGIAQTTPSTQPPGTPVVPGSASSMGSGWDAKGVAGVVVWGLALGVLVAAMTAKK